jgi:DNA-binding MarR family transcriptional regulator
MRGTRLRALTRGDEIDRARSVAGNAQTLMSTRRDETFADCLRKLVQLFPQVSRGLRRRQLPAAVVDDSALGPRHSAALSLLRERGPMSVGRIASELGLTLATVSGIITDAERAGFVERSPDPGDRRRTIVSLVPTKRAAVNSWIDGASAPMRRVLDRLSPDERESFVKAMTLLEAELSADSEELLRRSSKGHRAEPAVAAEGSGR